MPEKMRATILAMMMCLCVCLCSCGKDEGNRKATVPVSGEVYVDDEPASGVAVVFQDVQGIDKQNPTQSSTFTDADGKFSISTYNDGDGAPEGEYVLTFSWREINMMTMRPGGPDKLNDRYSDPAKSEFRVTVQKGEPIDLGRIDLTTK